MRSKRVATRHAPIRAACGTGVSRVAAWGAVGSRAVEARGDTACADVCGMWHRRIAGSCVRSGGDVRVVAKCGDTACADVCGMWHRRIAGSCARRGGGACAWTAISPAPVPALGGRARLRRQAGMHGPQRLRLAACAIARSCRRHPLRGAGVGDMEACSPRGSATVCLLLRVCYCESVQAECLCTGGGQARRVACALCSQMSTRRIFFQRPLRNTSAIALKRSTSDIVSPTQTPSVSMPMIADSR